MSRIEFDVWLPGGDLTDTPDVVLSTDDQLTDAAVNIVTNGEGDALLEIHADHPDTQYLQRRGTVRARDTVSGFGLFWWILEEANIKLTSKSEGKGKVIQWTGRGALTLFDRYKLGHAVFAPGQIHRGDIDIPDYWTWRAESYGAIIVRFYEEAQNHSAANFMPDVVLDFTRTQDSNGNTWEELSDYQVKIGTGGMTILGDFLRQGGFLTIDRFTSPISLQAYESITEFRTDRTSATFAIGKVRFEAGINVATELPHKIAALRERSHNLTRRGDGDYQTFDGNGSGLPYMDFQDIPWTSDPTTVEAASDWNLFQRLKQSTLAVVQHKIGDGGTDGENGYMPGSHYWLGDLVTVHTGTGEYDLNEQALEVAGIRLFLRGADWMAEAQLGASVINARGAPTAPTPGSGTTIIRSGVELCRPGTEPIAFSAEGLVGTAHSTSPDDVESAYFIGFWEEGLQITAGADIPVGHTLIGVVAWNRDSIGPNAGRETAMYDAGGNTWVLDTESTAVGASNRIVQIWRCILTEPIPSGGYIRWAPKGPSVENDVDEYAAGRAMGVFEFGGALTDPSVGATAGAFGSAMNVTAPAGDVVIGGIARHEGTITGDGDWTAMVPWTEETSGAGVQITGVFGQYKLNSAGETWACTAGANKDWSGRAVAYTVETALADQGDGRVELVGTSVRAKRCDDTEHWLSEDDPTANDDETLGFRVKTLWLNTSTGEAWIASDVSAGAAVWEVMGSGVASGTVLEGVYEHSTTLSISSGADSPVSFDTDVSDAGAMHNPASNNSRIVVQTAQADKPLRIKANISIPAVATQWQGWIKKNGTTDMRRKVRALGGTGGVSTLQIDETFEASDHAASDYYEIMVRQGSGSNQNVGSATADARNIVQVTSG